MRRKATEVPELILLASLLVFVAGLCLQPVVESDLYFRLRVGAEIVARRALLERNTFSFTAPTHPDLDLSWAFEVALAFLHRWGGFRAIVIGKTVCVVATFAAAFALCRRQGSGAVPATIALALAALVMRERLVERPHIVSFAGEVLVMAALASVARIDGRWWRRLPGGGHSKILRPKVQRRSTFSGAWPGIVTPLSFLAFWLAAVVWANLHAGLFVGVLLALASAVGWLRGGAAEGYRRARGALMLAACLVLAAAVTPVGPLGMLRYLQLHVTLPRLHAIDEFRAATWRSDWPFFSWLVALTALLAVWRTHHVYRVRLAPGGGAAPDPPVLEPVLEPPPPGLPQLLPAAGMLILGLASVRFCADAALVSAPLAATGLTWLAGRLRIRSGTTRSRGSAAAAGIVAVGWVAAALIPRLADVRAGRRFIDLDVDQATLPMAALRFVETNGLRERMYNDFETGSYLLFQGYPRYRVFVDPRLPAYPVEMHRLLGKFDHDRASWGDAMTAYGVESALLTYAGLNRRVAWWDPEEWALVYRAEDARVFVRRRAHWRPLIAAHEIPATFAFTVEDGTATHPLDPQPARSPVTPCEWQRRLGELLFDLDGGAVARARPYFERALVEPGCLRPSDEAALAGWMGAWEVGATGSAGGAGQPGQGPDVPEGEHTLAHLNRALALAPGDTRTRANRATLLERIGRRTEAMADWRRVGAEAGGGTPFGAAAMSRAQALDRKLQP